MKLLTIIGARPQIIKAAALSHTLAEQYSATVEEVILHTGQHYDHLMSEVFFGEMDIPTPHYNLGVGPGTHAHQSARMLEGISEVLTKEKPDGVVIYGDTNSTLAGALATSQMQIPLFHIEAGLRSYYMPMPEEQNRIVADHLANICFAPTQTAMHNLRREGLVDSPAQFTTERKGRKAVLCGDVMLDNMMRFTPLAQQGHFLQRHSITSNGYLLATVHRDFNTDNTTRFNLLLKALDTAGREMQLPVIIPAHPRIAPRLDDWMHQSSHRDTTLRAVPPASYLEMLALEQGARIILTDSGGVQKEAYFCHRPCVILRPETEWKEIVEQGAALLADGDVKTIVQACRHFGNNQPQYAPLFGDGHAAEQIAQNIIDYLQ